MELTQAEVTALVTRSDLLESECRVKREQRVTWRGRFEATTGMGAAGGSSADRRLIIQAMAKLELMAETNEFLY